MNTVGEMFVPQENESRSVKLENEEMQNAAQLEPCSEMDPLVPTDMETLEQREMDEFFQSERLGRSETVYYPEESEMRSMECREKSQRLGEYRTFCDTRPGGSRYNIFADGKGK